MMTVTLSDEVKERGILCIGAHCDDIEIGCGGTLVDLVEKFPEMPVFLTVMSSNEARTRESKKSFGKLLRDSKNVTSRFFEFRDGYLPYHASDVKDSLKEVASTIDPALVITHCREDRHQDHQFIAELTHQLFRNSMIWEMEIPKYDGDMGRPNLYMPISQEAVETKVSCLLACYQSQVSKHWFSESTFRAITVLRGIECRAKTGHAEAFYVSKIVVG